MKPEEQEPVSYRRENPPSHVSGHERFFACDSVPGGFIWNITWLQIQREEKNICCCPVVSDSLQPHGLQPTRLLGQWAFPGKNTGVGCHFLLQGIFPTQGLKPGLLGKPITQNTCLKKHLVICLKYNPPLLFQHGIYKLIGMNQFALNHHWYSKRE